MFSNNEADAPCSCTKCSQWVDLSEMYPSEKWYKEEQLLICSDCSSEETAELEIDNQVEEIFDHVEWGWLGVRDAQAQLRELGFKPKNYPDLKSFTLASAYRSYKLL